MEVTEQEYWIGRSPSTSCDTQQVFERCVSSDFIQPKSLLSPRGVKQNCPNTLRPTGISHQTISSVLMRVLKKVTMLRGGGGIIKEAFLRQPKQKNPKGDTTKTETTIISKERSYNGLIFRLYKSKSLGRRVPSVEMMLFINKTEYFVVVVVVVTKYVRSFQT